jgi:hypothetical protein
MGKNDVPPTKICLFKLYGNFIYETLFYYNLSNARISEVLCLKQNNEITSKVHVPCTELVNFYPYFSATSFILIHLLTKSKYNIEKLSIKIQDTSDTLLVLEHGSILSHINLSLIHILGLEKIITSMV